MMTLLHDVTDDMVHVGVGTAIQNGDGDEVMLTYCFQTAIVRLAPTRARAYLVNGFRAAIVPNRSPTCIQCVVKASYACLSDKHLYGAW